VPAGILTDSTDGIFRCAPGDFAARLDDETRTGLGHINKPLYPALRRAQEKGIAMYMTVQTLWGYVQMFVYDTGRDIMELGVVPAANMLPEVAYIKLGWALGQSSDLTKVKEIMLTSIAGEITEREPHNGYLILQGGIPEVERFVSSYWK
jgi:glutamyl-tRNA(Gln) amidotransferase subunit D